MGYIKDVIKAVLAMVLAIAITVGGTVYGGVLLLQSSLEANNNSTSITRIAKNGSNYEVFLSDGIAHPIAYLDLATLLATAETTDTVTIHLQGRGGDAMTILYFYNIIQRTKATVVMSVEGEVLSADAFIAFAGHKLVIDPLTVFMFHYPAVFDSTIGEYVLPSSICKKTVGRDRGIPNSINCLAESRAFNKNMTAFFNAKVAPLLTKQEKAMYYAGYQIYITGADMTNRINNLKK